MSRVYHTAMQSLRRSVVAKNHVWSGASSNFIEQVERCRNPFWLGTPHVASEDFTYHGNFIPKDTVVVLNTWTMHHDANRHSEPNKFDVCLTERFIYHMGSCFTDVVARCASLIAISTILLPQLRARI